MQTRRLWATLAVAIGVTAVVMPSFAANPSSNRLAKQSVTAAPLQDSPNKNAVAPPPYATNLNRNGNDCTFAAWGFRPDEYRSTNARMPGVRDICTGKVLPVFP